MRGTRLWRAVNPGSSLAAGSRPELPGLAWPVYDPATDPYAQLDDVLAAGTGVRTAACDFWDRLTPGL